MKINGSLVFDASTASEIQNLRLQKITALPGILSSDVGRLVYNTNTNIIYVGTDVGGATGLSWVPLATGGDASALLAEVDRIETSLGLNADGSFNAAGFTGTLAGQTSYAGLITTLQSLAASASAAAAAEAARATAAEGVLTTRVADAETAFAAGDATNAAAIAAETTRATTAETANATAITTETTRATTAEGALGTRVDGVVSAATAESTRVDGLIATEAGTRAAADTALDGRITTESAARAAGDTTNATAITAEATRATAAEGLLDGRITTEVADRTAAVNIVATGLATEITDRQVAITTVTTALGNEVTRATAQEAAIRGELASAVAGLSWEAPVDRIVTNHATETGLSVGNRVVNMTNNTIFTVTAADTPAGPGVDGILGNADDTAAVAATFGAGEVLVDGAAFFNRTNDIGYTFNGTSIVPFSGASSFVAGAGLSLTGNTVNVGNVDGSITITADEISVSAAVRNEITSNATAISAETTRATTAETGLGQRITDEEAARIAAVSAEAARATAAETANATAITAETTRATAAEAALGTRVDDANTASTAAVAAEAAARAAADTALGGRIDTDVAALAAEVARATAAEGVNAGAITAETTRATAAEGALGTRIDGVVTSATAQQTATAARISSMYFLYASATPATLHTVTHSIGQKYCNVTVVDSTDNVVIPETIQFTDANSLVVTFNTAIDCRVVVMGLAPVA